MDKIDIITFTSQTVTATTASGTPVTITSGSYWISAVDWLLIAVVFALIMAALFLYKIFSIKWN